jgi:hypothetical protein
MPLSPHEEKALAALEEGLRAEDPAFAAVLEVTPPSSVTRPSLAGPPTMRHILGLLLALLGLIAAGTLFADRPAVLAVVTGALLLPWLIGTARSTARRAGPAGIVRIRKIRRRARGTPRLAWIDRRKPR